MSSARRLQGVVHHVVVELVRRGQLELVEGADPDQVTDAVLEEIEGAAAFAQAGSTIAHALLRSPSVEEIYADDVEIVGILNHMYG